jgi:hypothetical protein
MQQNSSKSLQQKKRIPALGAAEGVRQDVQAAKEAGVPYDPRGVGVAWTHDFLNKKPWHPMNFRNRARVWEAQQRNQEDQASKERARREFEAEQHYLKTISMLSSEEQERYRQRQSVSWLYMRPPGYSEGGVNGEGSGKDVGVNKTIINPSSSTSGTRLINGHATRSHNAEHVSKVLQGIRAVAQTQLELKRKHAFASSSAGGENPPDEEENQRLVMPNMDSEDEERAFQLLKMSEQEREDYFSSKMKQQRRKKQRRKKQRTSSRTKHGKEESSKVQEAKQFLRSIGINVTDSDEEGDGKRDRDALKT